MCIILYVVDLRVTLVHLAHLPCPLAFALLPLVLFVVYSLQWFIYVREEKLTKTRERDGTVTSAGINIQATSLLASRETIYTSQNKNCGNRIFRRRNERKEDYKGKESWA